MLYELNDFLYPLHSSNPKPMFIHGFGEEFRELIAHYVERINHYRYDSVIYDGGNDISTTETTLIEQIESRIRYHREYVVEDYITNTKFITSPQEYDPSITTHYLNGQNIQLLEQIITHCKTNHNPYKHNATIIVYNIKDVPPHIIEALIEYQRTIVIGDCSILADYSTLRQWGSYILCENLPQRNLEVPNNLKIGHGVYRTSYSSGFMHVHNNIEQLYRNYTHITSRIVRILHRKTGDKTPIIYTPLRKQHQQQLLPQEYFYTINSKQKNALDLRHRCEQAMIHNEIKGIAFLEREDEILKEFIIQFGTMIKNYVEGTGDFNTTILHTYCNDSRCIIPHRYQEKLLYWQHIYF